MKKLLFAVVFIVAGIELGGMAYDKMQANITEEITSLYEQAEEKRYGHL